jgi:hypothetical protein
LEELSSVLLEVSLDGDEVVALGMSLLGDDVVVAAFELSTVDEVLEGDDESVLLMLPGVLLLVPSFVGRAEVEGELPVVGATYGLDAALGELLLGTESLVWAMVTPAALTMAMTAAMLRVLDRSFIFRTPLSVNTSGLGGPRRDDGLGTEAWATRVPNLGFPRTKNVSDDPYPRLAGRSNVT